MKKYKFIVVDGKAKKFKGKVSYNKYGLPISIDDYGMGNIHWPLISDKSDLDDRQKINNYIWAVERLLWATNEKCENERENCLKILLNGGKR